MTLKFTGLKVFLRSKVLCALFVNSHFLLFLPLSPLECKCQEKTLILNPINNLNPVHIVSGQSCMIRVLFQEMAPCKAPGNDGLTVRFMRKFWVQLGPLLFEYLKESWDCGELSNSQEIRGSIGKLYLSPQAKHLLQKVKFTPAILSIANILSIQV